MNSASFVLLAVFATLCINLPILTARSVPEAEAKRHKRDQDNHQGSPGQMKDDNPFGVIGLTKYKNPKWLVNNHDKKLEIDNNGTVKGSSKFTRHGVMHIKPETAPNIVSIRGNSSSMYLCVNETSSTFYGSNYWDNESCSFIETMEGSYSRFHHAYFPKGNKENEKYYLSIWKNESVKPGRCARKNQNGSLFHFKVYDDPDDIDKESDHGPITDKMTEEETCQNKKCKCGKKHGFTGENRRKRQRRCKKRCIRKCKQRLQKDAREDCDHKVRRQRKKTKVRPNSHRTVVRQYKKFCEKYKKQFFKMELKTWRRFLKWCLNKT